VLGALLGTLWAWYRAYTGSTTRRLLTAGWIMSGLTLLEGAIGAVLGATGSRPGSGAHFIIGPLTLLPLPAGLVASRWLSPRAAAVAVAAGWLLTTGLALRATGSGGLGG